ncbi:hypothetical protein [Actinophytocola sp.]|uniref:hypothetical protein n=1 Tax=Actinophytocola sp. TaxID=1872138 RepID=UPI002D8017F9|nr:hypothetical protein [Actinophytocola sp.]HET9141619.1 hypothetical protein [Actinophytocola sp.]HEU5111253.1 hypothetical protein [Micromonosporaceae bacterium]
MFDDLAFEDGSGIVVPPDGDAPSGLVLQFPVEIEVRMVAPYDPDELVSTTLDRLTSALRGLA